ncbi:RNA-binding cell elongation regulator Jag/EloR [Clostridium sp. 'deep sea']|uniref:RNA-binding cell elongation regulator Jag/EloR n=1 Tax=Clostridium sp. 'deep sea' TaxID=2779445 RepID=UPI00243463FF|nr:RNA-binding cell elongation regulator Jag/EloR [Clostridium sp. 'deep sea']
MVDFVQQICDKIVAGCKVNKLSEDEEGLSLTIIGDDIGLIVGKHGETLNSIQYLAAMVYSRQQGSYKRVSVDAGGYRERREKKIIEFGTRMAQKASRTGRRISLEPMNSYERRIVHMALQDMDGISTFSEGEEPNRRVVIAPANERSSNRYSRSNRKYNNSKDDRYRKDRPNNTPHRSSNRSSNSNNNNTSNNNTKNNNTKKVVKPKKNESNPYEHYYSKYDNRYKK